MTREDRQTLELLRQRLVESNTVNSNKIIRNIDQLLLADDAREAGNRQLFNQIMGVVDHSQQPN